jgi:UDP-N-acetylmuramate dehydrogenase
MREATGVPLSQLTTLRVGGPATRLLELDDPAELVDVVASCDSAGEPLLLLAGGSNVVVADSGFPGTVVLVRTRGRRVAVDDGAATVTVAAGEDWDDLVATAVAEGWVGIEALSGIPGSCGAAPIQNVGAYGQEVSATIIEVRAFDRADRRVVTLACAECGFGYRSSRFKREPERFVVLDVTFRLPRGTLSAPVSYAELARRLGVGPGERAPLEQVREAVLALRRSKGMVLDEPDRDTWSAGSFFTNPVLPPSWADRLPATAPRWVQPDGRVKTSAAWLIEHAGFERGYGMGPARLSGKHALALTNRGGATAEQLLALAREIRDGVRRRYGIELVNEPVIVGAQL